MSKVIDFYARDFRFNDTCSSNVGFRGFITTALGNEEIWEIGDWGWNWTDIRADKFGLEKNTDYVFRFAMTGGHNDDGSEVSMVHIYYLDDSASQAGPDQEKQNADGREDRFTYCIQMSKFQPVLSKRDKTGMLRVFELPFHTGEHENWRIAIISQHAIARFFPAREPEAYSELEDLSFEQWYEERMTQLRKWQKPRPGEAYLNLKGAHVNSAAQLNRILDLITEKGVYVDMQDVMLNVFEEDDDGDDE